MTRLLTSPADPTAFPPQQMLRVALDPADPSLAVVGWQGQRLRDAPRLGDLLIRTGLGTARVMRVEEPSLQSPSHFARRGILTEHRLQGRFVCVVERPGAWPMGRRLLGPDGLVIPDTHLLRPAAPGETLAAPAGPRPTIRRGSSGPAVAEAQALINRIDAKRAAAGAGRIDKCPLVVDGRFGPETRAATVSFQHIGFPGQPNEWDGIIGPKTWAMLDVRAREVPDLPPIEPPDEPPTIPPGPPIVPVASRPPNPPRWGPLLGGLPNAPLRRQNAVRAIVDGPEAYRVMLGDLRRAANERSFVYLLGWDCYDYFPLDPSAPDPCATSLSRVLADCVAAGAQVRAMIWRNVTGVDKLRATVEAARRLNALAGPRGNGACIVDARSGGATALSPATIAGLLNAATAALSPLTLLPGIGPEAEKLNRRIAAEIDQALRNVLAAHHQKVMVVFDGEQLIAYCGGIDVNPNRATTAANCIPGSTPQVIAASDPQHDTHCRILGPAAADLLKTFVDRWLDHPGHGSIDRSKSPLRGDPISAVPSPPQPDPSSSDAPFGGATSVIIARTYTPPAGGAISRQRDVRTLLQRAIENATSFIYLEDQYLWDFETPAAGPTAVATLLNRALPRLKHVTALVPANAVSSPSMFQRAWRTRFIDEVRRGHGSEIASRFRVFQLNRGSCDADGCLGRHTYVHSKCWVFDDELAVIGSANCNRRGYQHDSEVDAFIFDESATNGGGPGPSVLTAFAAPGREPVVMSRSGLTFAQRFRMRLWQEHLGVSVSDGADTSAWPTSAAPAGNVVPFLSARPPIISPAADRLAFPIIDRIAEMVRPIFDPTSP